MAEQTRISVALTPEDHREVLKLARRCNTSASALGQLAVRHMLLRESDGTVPMLPAEPPSTERPYSEQLAERAAEGIAFWRDGEADSPSLPDTPGMFGDADFGQAPVFTAPEPRPEPAAKVRVSVGLLDDEAGRINALAQRCSTSASALGELAYKQLLLQAENGAIPLLPVSTVETAELVHRYTFDDSVEVLVTDRLLTATAEIDRLIALTGSAPNRPGEDH